MTSTATSPQDGEEAEPFFSVERLTNHWARPSGPRSYYWFLTFDHHPQMEALARRCQSSITFPYYDLTPPDALHMTLERIGFEREISPQQLGAVLAAATRSCLTIAPLEITVGKLGGTSGAVGFSAYPRQPIQNLRSSLRAATLKAHPIARVQATTFHPHVTIAYSNTADLPAAAAVEAVKSLNGVAAELTVTDVSLVLLSRLSRAYSWTTVARLPLSGVNQT